MSWRAEAMWAYYGRENVKKRILELVKIKPYNLEELSKELGNSESFIKEMVWQLLNTNAVRLQDIGENSNGRGT